MNPLRRLLRREDTARAEMEPETERTRPCPHCKRLISRGATVCLHCEQEVVPLLSYAQFAVRFGSPHSGGPPHTRSEDGGPVVGG